jgi:WD40 repeat protein
VIVSTTGAYIWSADGSSMLFFVALSALAEGDLEYQFMRGIAGSATTIFLGTSLGQIVEVAVPNSTGECGIEVTSTATISKYPIGCIGTCDSFLVVGDENGDIQGFQISPRLRDHPLFSRPGQGYPCTSILIKSDSVIAAFTSGHIRGYRISTGEQVIELTAHVRCITGLVLHPYENIFASVAEDQYVCVWSFSDFSSKNTKSIELLCAEKLDNHLCTGLCYFEDDRIGVTSYDEDEVVVLQRIP